jgi:hypothetical protein
VWLVVWNMSSQKAYVLKTLMWNMQLDILVNPERPLGEYFRFRFDVDVTITSRDTPQLQIWFE